MKLVRNLVALGVAVAVAAPAYATITFANFSPRGTTRNVVFVEGVGGAPSQFFTGAPGATTPTAVRVNFNILVGDLDPFQGIDSDFLLDASAPASSFSSVTDLVLSNLSGSFSFTARSPITYGGITGTNLLSGTFTGGNIAIPDGSSSGGANLCSDCVGGIIFTSDFLNFQNVDVTAFAWSLTSINPVAGVSGDGSLRSFNATMSGDFASDPLPGVVPEPESWAMLVIGFGFVGATIRRRRRTAVVA